MPFLFFLLILVIGFIVDCIVAFVAGVLAPSTGLEFIQNLDFWNWFWTVVLVQVLMWPAVARSSS